MNISHLHLHLFVLKKQDIIYGDIYTQGTLVHWQWPTRK